MTIENITFNDQEEYDHYILNHLDSRGRSHHMLKLIDVTFKSSMLFENTTNTFRNIEFSNVTFDDLVTFFNLTFVNKFNLSNLSFSKDVFFSECTFNTDLILKQKKDGIEQTYNTCLKFSSCIFHETLDISHLTFKKGFYLMNSTFNKKVNAWNIKSGGRLDFKYSNFLGRVNLSELRTLESETLEVDFHGAKFEERLYLYGVDVTSLNLDRTVLDKELTTLDSNIKMMNRETARIIKNEFISQNNKIESLKYFKIEMDEYRNEINKLSNKKSDKLILFLNRISNNYNTSPIQAFIFILSTSLCLFILYIISLEDYGHCINKFQFSWDTFSKVGTLIGDYFTFINPIRKPSHLIDISNSIIGSWTTVIDSISKIIIGYGYYQFIQAFRKFGKK